MADSETGPAMVKPGPGLAPRPAVPPPPLPGFDHIKRYYDPRFKLVVAKILPGEYYVTTANELVSTVLGSCVSACVWDPEAKIGGMNHFMIPNVSLRGVDTSDETDAGRYGIYAMEFLINSILSGGGKKSRLMVKLAGGGQVVRSATTIGADNVVFARQYLEDEGLRLVGEHVEGPHARRLAFDPLTGTTKVMELSTADEGQVVRREQTYAKSVSKPKSSSTGSVELF